MPEKTSTKGSKRRGGNSTAAQADIMARWMEQGKQPEVRKEEIAVPSVGEIVGGDMYPSCIECYNDGTDCLWEFGVIRARMQLLDPESICERCRVNGRECQFVWGVVDFVKKIEDVMGKLVRHSHSQHRKATRAFGEKEAARNALREVMAELSDS